MGRSPSPSGYVVRRELNALKRKRVEVNQMLEKILRSDSQRLTAMYIAQAVLTLSAMGEAVDMLEGILLKGLHEE